MKLRIAIVVVALLSLSFSLPPRTFAQTSTQTTSALPRLVRFGGTAKDLNGSPMTGVVGITFAFYSEQNGGSPLWLETQNATADSTGHYSVLLGSTKPDGLPAELFTSEQARWVGVQVSGQAEQPRVLLVSAPYALKAGDAETIGGLPPSAFVLAAPAAIGSSTSSSTAATVPPPAATDVTTTGGTLNYLPIFSGADTIIDSAVFQTGSGTTAKIGIDTTTPVAQLDVNGAGNIRGTLSLPATGVATAAGGKNSQGLNLVASSFSSTSSTAANQVFRWQAEPAANDTSAPSGTLNLQYGLGATTPSETGLKISSKGLVTFATGQTFPGTGAGTITGITTAAGSGLAGGGVKGTLSLSVPTAGITNAMLAHPSLTVTPGTGLTGGGLVALGNSITLSVNTAKIPQLGTANTFVGNQTVTGNLTASGEVQGGVVNATTSFDIGGTPFAFGSSANLNAFLGFSGPSTTTGQWNLAVGPGGLAFLSSGSYNTVVGAETAFSITSGANNTAVGVNSLIGDTTGYQNTAVGVHAAQNTNGYNDTAVGASSLAYDFTGNGNTALGAFSGPDPASTALVNTTAVGGGATVSASNALVLGVTTAGSPGAAFVNVGIGTATPRSILEAAVSAPGSLGPTLTLTNTGGGSNTASSLDFNTYLPSTTGTYTPGARIEAFDDGNHSDDLLFQSNIPGAVNNGLQTNMEITSSGQVIIGGDYLSGNFILGSPSVHGYDLLSVMQLYPETTKVVGGTTEDFNVDAVDIGGFQADFDSNQNGGTGLTVFGGEGDLNNSSTTGGEGLIVNPGCGGAGCAIAATFTGSVQIDGLLNGSTPEVVQIDHPLDAANKYLVHSSVQSSEMMNLYTGNVTTDGTGLATVQLPDWFEAANADFRYQLTPIGQFAQAIVNSEVAGHQFGIKTDKPNVKVSWQITAVRQDAYAKAHPLVVEPAKNARERGHYIHPELYGASEAQNIEWARHPAMMRRLQIMRARQLAGAKGQATNSSARTLPLAVPPTPKLVQQKLPTPRVAPIRPGTSQKLPAQSTLQPVEPK